MSEQNKKTACVSRYPGQKILIGDSITVRISRIEGQRVYVYVEGPLNLSVTRPTKEADQSDREIGRQNESSDNKKSNEG